MLQHFKDSSKNQNRKWFNQINEIILSFYNLKPEIIALDGTGFTSDQGDIYYRKKAKKRELATQKTIFQ